MDQSSQVTFVTPKVFLLAASQPDSAGVEAWLDQLDAGGFRLPPNASPGESLTVLAGKRCYLSFDAALNENLTRVRAETAAFIDNILSSKHGSVLEHTAYTFGIENVSRVFTAEMNRHRAGWSVSEGSGRFIRTNLIKVTLPKSLRHSEADSAEICEKKRQTQEIFLGVFESQRQAYLQLCDLWGLTPENTLPMLVKKQLTSLFRRILGIGLATGGVWTGNLRALRHFFSIRVTPQAEEEICEVGMLMFRLIYEREQAIFKDFEKTDEMFLSPLYWKI